MSISNQVVERYQAGDTLIDIYNDKTLELSAETIISIIEKAVEDESLNLRRPAHYLSKRNIKILDQWNSGEYTYESISKNYSITRERIRQILKKAAGKGFYILNTQAASQQRKEARINSILDNIDQDEFIKLYLSSSSVNEVMSYFDISYQTYCFALEQLTKKGLISSKAKILSEVKISMESVDEITKYREKTILQMRSENKSYEEIQAVLHLSKPRISQIIKTMKDKGIEVPNSRNSGWFLDEEETLQRVNSIEKCLDEGMNIPEMSNILNITTPTVQKIIYRYLVDKS